MVETPLPSTISTTSESQVNGAPHITQVCKAQFDELEILVLSS